MKHDVIVIGSGPAGLTAGIYLSRFKRDCLIIDGDKPGGQLISTGAVENWPGELSINGPDLMKKMREQAQQCGCSFLSDIVTSLIPSDDGFTVTTKNDKTLQAKSIIIATGSSHRKLHIPGEAEYWGKGVAVCATCDAPFYQDKDVVIVGGGNSAIAQAYALAKFAKQVTIVQLGDSLTATDPLKDKVLAESNVTVMCNKKVVEIVGKNDHVTSILLEDTQTQEKTELATYGIFIGIGMIPSSQPFKELLELDECGYIIGKSNHETSQAGIFVAGDVSDARYQQAITASGMGCMAALECDDFLKA